MNTGTDFRRRALALALSPRVIAIVFLGALALTILCRPRIGTIESEARLTTYASDANGAQGLFEVLARLGWQVERRLTPFADSLDRQAVYAVLAPREPLTARESHLLLEAVRAGAKLIVVPHPGTALSDSLRIRQSGRGFYTIVGAGGERDEVGDADADRGDEAEDTGRIVTQQDAIAALMTPRPSGCEPGVFDQPFGTRWLGHYLELTASPRGPTETLLEVDVPAAHEEEEEGEMWRRPAVLGLHVGRGRVVAVADPHMLRNDVVRLCNRDAGVRAVQMFQWLSPQGGRVVFDEYHQGFGRHPSMVRATRDALVGTAPGRMLLQAVAAGLILVLARSPRPLPPVPRGRVERRSPLEYVAALARAYEQIGATRTAIRRLVRGVRRRVGGGPHQGDSDQQFLQQVAARHPEIAADVAALNDAIQRPVTPDDFLAAGRAVDRIEKTVTRR